MAYTSLRLPPTPASDASQRKHPWLAFGCAIGVVAVAATAVGIQIPTSTVQISSTQDMTSTELTTHPPIMASTLNCTWSCLE